MTLNYKFSLFNAFIISIFFFLGLMLVYQGVDAASCETCMQVKKQQLELDMEQQTGSK